MESVKNNITKMISHTFNLFNYLGYNNYKSGDNNKKYDNCDKYISSMESGMLINNDNGGYDDRYNRYDGYDGYDGYNGYEY